MKEQFLVFAEENALSPFGNSRNFRTAEREIYKTKDARAVHTKLLNLISKNFIFSDTGLLLSCIPFTESEEIIKSRQKFFSTLVVNQNRDVLRKMTVPRTNWRPSYGVIVVTEDEKTFTELKKLNCPCKFIVSQHDLPELEEYDLVQVIDCENFSRVLEQLPQAVFVDSIEDVYLERYLQQLATWKSNIELFENSVFDDSINQTISKLKSLMPLLESDTSETLSLKKIEESVEHMNDLISKELEKLTLTGNSIFAILSKGSMPKEVEQIIQKAIVQSGLEEEYFTKSIPITINEPAADIAIRKAASKKYSRIAERNKKYAPELRAIPKLIEKLVRELVVFDFVSGLAAFCITLKKMPQTSDRLNIREAYNLFLPNPSPISFMLDNNYRCSMLTGANSGGKTTLLEHIIQLVSLHNLGLPVSGDVELPLFTSVYYFAKSKGATEKGAFEHLLSQMSSIEPGSRTLILADEIEAVTEPGVAGTIVCASADYFLRKGCFLVIATHLGKEIQKRLPFGARIDGIEAKGLDENYNLIVDHNPVLGRLAHSTPELIVDKMAGSLKKDYFLHVQSFLKRDTNHG